MKIKTRIYKRIQKNPMLQVTDHIVCNTEKNYRHYIHDMISNKIKHYKTWNQNDKIDFGDS